MRRTLAAAAVAVLLLAGCGDSSPAQELADRADAVTRAANDGDADAFRDAADALADTVSVQRDAEQLTPDRARRLLALVDELRRRAPDVDPEVRAAREAAARQAAAEAAAKKAAAEKEAAARAAAERAAAEAAAAQAAREAAARADAERRDDDDDEDRRKGRGKGEGKDDD